MKQKEQEKIPADIYGQCVAIAKSYYTMIRRRQELEEMILHGSPDNDGQPKGSGTGNPTARKAEQLLAARERNDQKIRAVEQAFFQMQDKCAQDFIRCNLFEGKQMQYICLPISERTMKRYRSKYIRLLARELGEI